MVSTASPDGSVGKFPLADIFALAEAWALDVIADIDRILGGSRWDEGIAVSLCHQLPLVVGVIAVGLAVIHAVVGSRGIAKHTICVIVLGDIIDAITYLHKFPSVGTCIAVSTIVKEMIITIKAEMCVNLEVVTIGNKGHQYTGEAQGCMSTPIVTTTEEALLTYIIEVEIAGSRCIACIVVIIGFCIGQATGKAQGRKCIVQCFHCSSSSEHIRRICYINTFFTSKSNSRTEEATGFTTAFCRRVGCVECSSCIV